LRSHPSAARVAARFLLPIVLAGVPAAARAAGTPADGIETASRAALRHVHQLAEVIGPRKTGTEGERRAIEYVRQEMAAAGLAVALEDVTTVAADDGEERVGSWNIIGDLAGDLPDRIVLAAHHDTRAAGVPGANDDASGIGVLLEVARRVAARPRRLSYRFISFCAEEEDLAGSRHHVRHADLAGTRVMVALEVIGRGDLLVGGVPRPAALWAQRALAGAARDAGLSGIASRPLWAVAPRILPLPYSADHEPFLDRGIPAFLVAGAFAGWAYHTPEDRLAHLDGEVLGRAVLLVDALLRRFEAGPPKPVDDPHYLPLTLFGRGVVVTSPVLRGLGGAALAAVAALALLGFRRALAPRAMVVLFRVVLVTGAVTALGISGPFAAAAIMRQVHDARYPWMAHQAVHLGCALAAFAATGWLALNIFRRIKPTVDPAPYLRAALILPVAGVVVAGFVAGRPEIAAFPAVTTLAFVLSGFTASVGRKIGLGLVALLPFFLLLTPDDYRVLVEVAGVAPSGGALSGLVFVVVLPFAFYAAHVGSFQDCLHSRFWWWLSGRRVGGAALVAAVALGAVAGRLPGYDAGHRQVVMVRQTLDLDNRTAEVRVESDENLRGGVLGGNAGRPLSGREMRFEAPLPADRFGFEAILEPGAMTGGERQVTCRMSLRSPLATDRVTYRLASKAGFRVPADPESVRHEYRIGLVAARVDPVETMDLILPESADLEVTVEAGFTGDLLAIDPRGRDTQVFVHRGRIRARRVLAAGS
jgi:hypothetical protein